MDWVVVEVVVVVGESAVKCVGFHAGRGKGGMKEEMVSLEPAKREPNSHLGKQVPLPIGSVLPVTFHLHRAHEIACTWLALYTRTHPLLPPPTLFAASVACGQDGFKKEKAFL